MRQFYLVLASAGLIVLLSADQASAQRNGNRGNRGYSAGNILGMFSGQSGYGNYGRSGYGYQQYGSQGYSPYGQNYGLTSGLSRNNLGYSQSYYAPAHNTQQYYQASPYTIIPTTYYETVPTVSSPVVPVGQYATINVSVPKLDTQIWLGSTLMNQTGMERVYQSTPLEVGSTYTYTITARWMSGGKQVEQIRTVDVRAGKTSNVEFLAANRDNVTSTDRPISN